MTECSIMRLDKAAMVRVLHEQPEFSERFTSYLLTRTVRVEADLVDELFNSSERRLARALLHWRILARRGSPSGSLQKSAKQTLADMVGTTRSRVNTFMNKFRKMGFIDYNGVLEVHNSLLTMVLHDAPQIRRDNGNEE